VGTIKRNNLSIRSEVVFFPSRSGHRIVGYVDQAEDCPEDAGFIVVTPKFGETKKNNLQLAYQLAANHLRVLRFDHTFHVGESDGEIEGYTFSGAITDILSAIDFLELQHRVEHVQVLANSLSARCALRVAAVDHRVSRLVTMVGVINFQHTASVVYQQDMVDEFQKGRMQGISDILGHQVDVDQFLTDCIENNLHDLDGSIEDVRKAKCEIFFFSAERDVWVKIDEVKLLRELSDLVTVATVEGAMHELRENPKAAEKAAMAMLYACKTGDLPKGDQSDISLTLPDAKTLFAQNRIERERLRAAAPLRESEQDFWKEYLHKYNILEAVGDYQEYLRLIGDNLGPVEPGMVYFDCGCGNGLFGAWCVRDILSRCGDFPQPPPVYFGLDLTARGLTDASGKHSGVGKSLGGLSAKIDLMYLRFDLDDLNVGDPEKVSLPFEDATVDRVCCSLLISYLKHPEILLSELCRILRPGGRIIVSSMKPYCDLSQIYKDVVDEADSGETLQSARNLLSAAGSIKLKEEEGHYKFYDKQELIDCVNQAGFIKAKAYRSFGDQANLVAAEK